jgi:hypothetical protein
MKERKKKEISAAAEGVAAWRNGLRTAEIAEAISISEAAASKAKTISKKWRRRINESGGRNWRNMKKKISQKYYVKWLCGWYRLRHRSRNFISVIMKASSYHSSNAG